MMKTLTILCTLLVALTIAKPVLAKTRDVDCDRDESITKAFTEANPGDTIRVKGTCKEVVVVTTDRLTLEGRNNAVLDGEGVDLGSESGLLTIESARGFVITGQLSIQNSAAVGIIVRNNANASFRGSIESRDNGNHGILVINSASVQLDEGTLTVENNGGDGVPVVNGASVYIPPPPAGVMLTSNGNRRGIHIINGGSFEALGGTISAAENQLNGITVALGSDLLISSRASVSLQNNPQGLNLESSSQALVIGATIEDNATAGISSVQASFINLRGATIANNGPGGNANIVLSFGAVATLTGNAIDDPTNTITCDATVLLGGDTGVVCPNPIP